MNDASSLDETTPPPEGPGSDDRLKITIRIPGLRSLRRAPRGAWVWGVVALLAAVTTIWSTVHLNGLQAKEDREHAARLAAQARVPKLLSYRADRLQADLEEAGRQTTGRFGKDYAQVLEKVVKPNATDSHITNAATVKAAGVVSSAGDRVVALVFITQTTRSKDVDTPQVSNSRIEVTMTRIGDDWLISSINPV